VAVGDEGSGGMTRGFRVNSPSVIHETIEGEVILIDLETGTYYSLREAGAAVWQAIEDGADEEGIQATLEQRYEGAPDEMREALRGLLAELEGEGLIRPDEDAAPAAPAALPASNGDARAPFRRPTLEKHTDMQDLILIDPVHEVGARGWPHPAGADEAER
jgi:Coenzyme PQQ synthesis protein D (PqqD)